MADTISSRGRSSARVFLGSWLLIAGACADTGAADAANGTGMDNASASITPGASATSTAAAGASAAMPGKNPTGPGASSTSTGAAAGAAAKPSTAAASGTTGATAAAGASATGANGMPAAAGGGAGSSATAPTSSGAAGAANGAAGATASAAGSGAATGPWQEHADLGMGDGSDVVTVGDSWMSYALNGGGIETGLLAASGQRYRTYGLAGTMLLDEVIPNQYETAKRENPDIKTVVMTGGGNDLLLTGMTAGGCSEGCMSTINKVTDRLVKMWEEMAADGVQDVVYIEYSRGGSNAPGVNYANEVIPPKCAAAPVRCHFIDSDKFIDMVLIDGVHPTADGCTKLGKAAFDLMVEKGMRR